MKLDITRWSDGTHTASCQRCDWQGRRSAKRHVVIRAAKRHAYTTHSSTPLQF